MDPLKCTIMLINVQLEMERALLEGEYQTEMDELRECEDRIKATKQQQLLLLEQASQDRQQVTLVL